MVSCSDDKEEQGVKPAADLVVDNSSVTLLQWRRNYGGYHLR